MHEALWGEPVSRPAEANEQAWHGLEDMREGLRIYLVRLGADENDLDDTIQETFLRAARYRCRRRVHHLRPWVLRIARNVLADGRRRRKRAGVTLATGEPIEVAVGAEGGLPGGVRIAGSWYEGEAVRELVQRGLARLRRDDHALLEGHYLEAQCAPGKKGVRREVKTRLYRARRKLRAVVCREVDLHQRMGVAS